MLFVVSESRLDLKVLVWKVDMKKIQFILFYFIL